MGKRHSSSLWREWCRSHHNTSLKRRRVLPLCRPKEYSWCVRSGFGIEKNRQRSTFFPQQSLNMAKHFHLLCDYLKTGPGHCETSWFKAYAAFKCCVCRLYRYICSSSVRCLTGARSVTSCAKFITKSSFVAPAQTIKGAAGMTSAWKIPHMERWKMTCGFLSAEASSAVWQGKRRGKKEAW